MERLSPSVATRAALVGAALVLLAGAPAARARPLDPASRGAGAAARAGDSAPARPRVAEVVLVLPPGEPPATASRVVKPSESSVMMSGCDSGGDDV
ncbi:MAG TPA: hypothetical protein VD838_14780, partial [Anaeromyxobacteraceae bacterium]|nr:hypothetical protein [Anaeromyxobacteraceae bacterium]